MTMPQAHYDLIAAALANSRPKASTSLKPTDAFIDRATYIQWEHDVRIMSFHLARASNGPFDRLNFLRACGLEG